MKHILPFLTVAMLLAACTQDELTDNTMLPEGMYPLEIASVTLSVEGGEAQPWGAKAPQTRVSENEYGTGSVFMPNDAITVSLGGETAAYTYDGNTWTSTAPLYWQNTETATVNAWYPTAENVSLADQSEGLAYVLKGSGTGSYQSGVNLTFTHQLAKVRVELTGEKASDVQKVEIYSYTTCTHNQGTISTDGASQNWITMHKVDEQSCYEANVVPGTITLDKFIRLNGSSVATVSGITDLAAGAMYTVNLNVKSPIPSDAKDITGDISNDGNYVVSGSRTTAINITGGSPHIYLDGATVSVSSGNAISITGNATPTIHVVGTNTVSSSNGAGIYVAQGSTVTITGDSRNDVLTSTGGAGSAGIGSYSTSDGTNYSCGNITISNVTLTARSEGSARAGDYAAGIGSAGVGTVGSISISDATIYAQGYGDNINMGAAAIGGGVDGTSSDIQTAFDITISNSTIHATRGCPHASYIGAGGLNGIKPAGYNIISTARITDSHVYDESGNEITQ